MVNKITYKPFGNKAILVEWNAIISEDILNDILKFKHKIAHQKKEFYTDLVVGYHSLTIKYKEEFSNFLEEVNFLKSIYISDVKIKKASNYLWEIPVCYNVKFGADLEEISAKTKLTTSEIIQLHSSKIYTVFFIGFLPGFLYLGGLNKQLFFDRKPNPRLKVDKGAVAIGGEQTGVYPLNSPGGWNIIGKTPVNFFDVENDNPCFAKAGDKIKFVSISLDEFYEIEKEITENSYKISKTLLND
ncbi:5-oxoprolinase subunit PxpB [Polaribacter sargassicola]|uniref:5-oxoprolinase subunit PxpB n=1 Tax=Polaribacter sargassicola TaxID=2836891 RepID=UPI001F293904|nr:5-oxoprolinase subunit PxpB [Polaribacter sp. DS7-9]MCG1036056.1 5-oxoprolinase subunit PxpB [Polaribacter sp. DS7-9]